MSKITGATILPLVQNYCTGEKNRFFPFFSPECLTKNGVLCILKEIKLIVTYHNFF